MTESQTSKIFNLTVIVSALGYFVDIYDLLLFAIVRVASLRDLGVAEDQMLSSGVLLLNSQMLGLLLGGLAWGILGDKRGRLSVLFGSIVLYSLANLLNAYVQNVEQYVVLRFLAGVGLAGELGAAVTLVSEIMSREKRTYGTTIIATVGITGAVFGGWVAERFDWRTAYIIGGAMGFVLLVLRIRVSESYLFAALKKKTVSRGSLRLLLSNSDRRRRLLYCFLVGVPVWYVMGILIAFSPELTKELAIVGGPAKTSYAVIVAYIGCSLGDLLSGLLSQYLRSRRKVLFLFISSIGLFTGVYGFLGGASLKQFYLVCFLLGLGTGFWAVFMMNASEQFGTNLRATVTTFVPNLVRGAGVPMALSFQALQNVMPRVPAACLVGVVVLSLSLYAVKSLPESFSKDLDFMEE